MPPGNFKLHSQRALSACADWIGRRRTSFAEGRFSGYARTLLLAGGVVGPIVCFVSAAPQGIHWWGESPWQSGSLRHYAFAFGKWTAASAFYPLLIYSMTCCLLVTIHWKRWVDRLWVRAGLYTGVILAVQYHFIVHRPSDWSPEEFVPGAIIFMAIAGISAVAVSLVPLIWSALRWLSNCVGRWRWLMWGGLGLAIVVGTTIRYGTTDNWWRTALAAPMGTIIVAWLVTLVSGTVWATMTYGLLSLNAWRHRPNRQWSFGLMPLLGSFTWLAGFLAAWRTSLQLAIFEYSQLPMEDPNCYVCTAAAGGHRWLVRREPVWTATGKRVSVNQQMRILKSAELVLRHSSPPLHRICRGIYDRWGRRVSHRLDRPWKADISYVTMKPVEMTCRAFLALLGIRRTTIDRLYTSGAIPAYEPAIVWGCPPVDTSRPTATQSVNV